MAIQEAKLAPPVPMARDLSALTEPTRITGLGTEESGEGWWLRWRLVVAAVSCWTLLALAFTLDHATSAPHNVVVGLYVAAYLAGGTFATIVAVRDLFLGQVNVDLLMVTAAIGAACVNAWVEGAVLLGLFSTSNALEHFALGRTQRAVKALMDLSPDVATVIRPGAPGGEAIIPVEELTLTDVVLVRPGERIAVDGVVTIGESTVDQAAITGESMPVAKRTGAHVFAGTINGNGALHVQVTKLARESTLSRIIAIVEEAREQKSQTQRFTDAFEGKYAIGVILASALVAILPPLVANTSLHDSFYRAMTLLVVASPCALVISTPASTLSALANAARHGILFKGSNHLENAGTVQTVAFDKTGTLTEGRPRVTSVVALNGTDEQELLRLTASAERLSEHHIAEAVVLAAGEQGLILSEPADFQAHPGKGVVARVDGDEMIIGNEMLLEELGVKTDLAAMAAIEHLRASGCSAIFIAHRCGVRGVIAVADTIRPQAAAAVGELKRLGIERTVMLTGDNHRVATAIAAQVGIDEIQADLLPEEKLDTIRELMQSGSVAMVGDGVNDAPALATATIGIAMGAAGTDVALETADVVLMADDLSKLPYAISLSRRTRRTIIQNLAFSLSVIVVLVTAALTIGIPLPLGVVGHEGSTIIVVTNGLRLLRTRD
ncbi:MAG: heavy metal translocating P-type ATPase [Thermomicrobiales bacterium]